MGEQPLLNPTGKWVIGGTVILALTVLGVGIAVLYGRRAAEPNLSESAGIEASVPSQITALGRIEPYGEIIDIGGPSGERIAAVLVKPGEQVKQGQPLVILESYEERLADREVAASQVRDLAVESTTTANVGKRQILEAATRIDQANLPKEREIAAQKANVARIETELGLATVDLQRFQELQRRGAISDQALDERIVAFKTKQQERDQALETLARLQQEQRTSVENAKAQLESTQADTQRSQAALQLNTARSNLKLAEARLARSIIRAPQAGQVLDILRQPGEAIEISTGTAGGQSLLKLGNTSQMSVVAEVYETDVRRVRQGQTAVITSPAFPGQLTGVVERIGLQINKNDVIDTDPAANTDTRVVEVYIRLQDSRPVAQLTNLQVDVAINTDTAS